ncbi:MATE family efflux transporter [Tuanshanicoccus lijuaniae]|uniref:MATE family efflux transporter n=1 Tax=Aerococcaceae bacterium zg-1292 TaxID=2774330 RepID=UPI0019371DB9|nr:MATE family efflux transporter [Aerococcaceae bacterium zg-1292]MBD3949488.1 MATE family efflux transporter [Aerococcaceae bacterium zg-1292]QQA36498.1 MATE family efflux transporter [Aerococcaceae bacterium zg-1292]
MFEQPTIEFHTAKEIKRLANLLIPVLIYQLASFSAQFIDTMMTGNYNEVHLAGVGIGGNLWVPFFTLFTGFISVLTPIVGQALGGKQYKDITHAVRQFIGIGIALSIIFFLMGVLFLRPILNTMTLTDEVRGIAFRYLSYLSMGIIPSILFTVLRSFVDGLGKTRVSMLFMLLLVPFNIILNYLFIYGRFGFPELGGGGAGLGTAISYWLVLGVILLIIKYQPGIAEYRILYYERINVAEWRSFAKMGFPIGLAIFAETSIFSFVGLLMSLYSAQVIAGHQAAMNFTSFLYSFPLSISSALMIAVSQEIGARSYVRAKKITRIGLAMSLVIGIMTMTFLFFNRGRVAVLYGKTPEFIQLTQTFLGYGLLFQVGDSFAAPIQGVLRGYKDTVVPFIIGMIGHWCIGIPTGVLLSKFSSLGPYSFWIGLITGLISVGIGLVFRLLLIERQYAQKNDY